MNKLRTDQKEILDLYQRVRVFPTTNAADYAANFVMEHSLGRTSMAALQAVYEIVSKEPLFCTLSPPNFDIMTLKEQTDFKALVQKKLHQHTFQHETLRDITAALARIFEPFATPAIDSQFQVPLKQAKKNFKGFASNIYGEVWRHKEYFDDLRKTLTVNILDVSHGKEPLAFPNLSDLPQEEFITKYFHNTPFPTFFDAEVPIDVPQNRFAHTHIIGSTGSGKTTLLLNLIAEDLKTDASVIVIDPHNQIVPQLSDLDIPRRKILIDPNDPPGFNIFDGDYGSAVKMLSYLFKEGDTPTTGKQTMVFQYLCRLMLSRRGTLMDLFNFLNDPAPFQDDIRKLPILAQSFFRDFNPKNPEYKNTQGELRYRLHAILSTPALEKVFSSPTTDVNMGAEMDEGSLVLIDANQSILGDFHAVFGKIYLEQILQAARERGENRHPTFVYIDEAHRFLDQQINDLLTDARKYKVGLILAHQHLDQIPNSVIAGALSGTGTKFAGGVRSKDARALAADMRTTPEFLLGLERFHFAVYSEGTVSSILPEPDPLKDFDRGCPPDRIERAQHHTDDDDEMTDEY